MPDALLASISASANNRWQTRF